MEIRSQKASDQVDFSFSFSAPPCNHPTNCAYYLQNCVLTQCQFLGLGHWAGSQQPSAGNQANTTTPKHAITSSYVPNAQDHQPQNPYSAGKSSGIPSCTGNTRLPSSRARAGLSTGRPTLAHSSGVAQRKGCFVSGQHKTGRKDSIQSADSAAMSLINRGAPLDRWP